MNEETKKCRYCGNEVKIEEGVQWGSYFYCDSCFKVQHCNVDGYHQPKIPTTFLKESGETTKLHFGFELEINKNNYGFCNENHTEAIFYIRKNFKHLKLNFERDGSIGDGFEIISQPMTYKYIKAHQEDFKQILQYLRDNGYRSHNTGICGLHIHISKDFLGDTTEEIQNTIDKITLFVETYYNNMVHFARRGNCDYCNYITPLYKSYFDSSVLPSEDYLKSIEVLKDLKAKTRRYATHSDSRYFVINTTNVSTVEYRMFKGTLKYETFMATLEFVNNLTNVCKANMVSKISWNKVINYGGDFIKEYNEGLNLIGDNYLRDFTEQINKNIERFKENDKKNQDFYNESYKGIVTEIEKLVNEKVDMTKSYQEIQGTLDFKKNLIEAIKKGILQPLEDSDKTIYEYIELMNKGNEEYWKNFKRVRDILENYYCYILSDEMIEKVKKLISMIKEKETNISQENC